MTPFLWSASLLVLGSPSVFGRDLEPEEVIEPGEFIQALRSCRLAMPDELDVLVETWDEADTQVKGKDVMPAGRGSAATSPSSGPAAGTAGSEGMGLFDRLGHMPVESQGTDETY